MNVYTFLKYISMYFRCNSDMCTLEIDHGGFDTFFLLMSILNYITSLVESNVKESKWIVDQGYCVLEPLIRKFCLKPTPNSPNVPRISSKLAANIFNLG